MAVVIPVSQLTVLVATPAQGDAATKSHATRRYYIFCFLCVVILWDVQEVTSVIHACMRKDPLERPSATEVYKLLELCPSEPPSRDGPPNKSSSKKRRKKVSGLALAHGKTACMCLRAFEVS